MNQLNEILLVTLFTITFASDRTFLWLSYHVFKTTLTAGFHQTVFGTRVVENDGQIEEGRDFSSFIESEGSQSWQMLPN
jgi:hypothetical protein